MDFDSMTFPLTVDVSGSQYWIGDQGPYKLGMAVTEFLASNGDGELRNELEGFLRSFGGALDPFVVDGRASGEEIRSLPERTAGCTVSYGYRPVPGGIYLVERYIFSSLRDFLLVELGKGILHGNCPRQCRLCGKWFFHEKGDRTVYCERVAPGETERTCREAGARAVFEKKLQDEDAWKIYKRAYKKYYARFMKGTMTQEEFRAWADQAAIDRDEALRQTRNVYSEVLIQNTIERLRKRLNEKSSWIEKQARPEQRCSGRFAVLYRFSSQALVPFDAVSFRGRSCADWMTAATGGERYAALQTPLISKAYEIVTRQRTTAVTVAIDFG